MFNLYWTLGFSVLSLLVGLFTGYKFEYDRFQNYRESVIVAQKVAQIETKRKEKESQDLTLEINNAYQNDIAIIHRFYSKRVQHHSNGRLPQIPIPTTGSNEITTDQGLIGRCAETTLMLTDLQQWIKDEQKVWMMPTEQK